MTYIETFEEYPIPFDREAIVELQINSLNSENGRIETRNDIITCVDEFHDTYIHEMVRTSEWSVFTCSWYWNETVYFWNHQLGYGLAADRSWETMCGFVEMMEQFTEEYSSEDFEPAHHSLQIP